MNQLPPTLTMRPLTHPIAAVVRVPGSKSHTNRALLAAALAEGVTTLTNALFSDNSQVFAESLARLGFDVRSDPERAEFTITGLGGRIPAARAELAVGNAGTAARFLTALLTLGYGEFLLDGDARMRQRPLSDLLAALAQLGAHVHSHSGCPPVRVQAAGLPGGQAVVRGEVSSQFLSGLLLVAPYAQSPVDLWVEGSLSSKPYVDLTLGVMEDFGISVIRNGYVEFSVTPQRYHARAQYAIESDASAASYFFALPAICGGRVQVQNLTHRLRQGDVAFVDLLARMGCTVIEKPEGIEVTGPADPLHGIEVDLGDMPDTAQTLAAVAPFASGPTTIRGIASARQKETDRVAALCAELARLGLRVEEHPDGLTITPGPIHPAVVRTYNDHRMAMAFALIGLRVPGITIDNPACVAKTFPNYFEVLEQLR